MDPSRMGLLALGFLMQLATRISCQSSSFYYPLLMPDVQPIKPESYLCTSFKMPRFDHNFVVEYLPNATKETAHHILIYGCEAPGYQERDTPRAVWNCGEMSREQMDEGMDVFPSGPVCKGQAQIIYSWAMDAPALKLPYGVGFKVGGRTSGINHLVMQVHYAHVHKFLAGATDQSGITLKMLPSDTDEITKLAGVYLLATDGRILSNTTEHFEAACRQEEPLTIHPFAYRTHTHKLGKVVSGYRVDGRTGEWQPIGKGNPQLPQMFYPITNPLAIHPGDVIAARCTMVNNQDHTVRVGMTGDDEMCNFYVMYWVDTLERILDRKVCFTQGPPRYYWWMDQELPDGVDRDASTLI